MTTLAIFKDSIITDKKTTCLLGSDESSKRIMAESHQRCLSKVANYKLVSDWAKTCSKAIINDDGVVVGYDTQSEGKSKTIEGVKTLNDDRVYGYAICGVTGFFPPVNQALLDSDESNFEEVLLKYLQMMDKVSIKSFLLNKDFIHGMEELGEDAISKITFSVVLFVGEQHNYAVYRNFNKGGSAWTIETLDKNTTYYFGSGAIVAKSKLDNISASKLYDLLDQSNIAELTGKIDCDDVHRVLTVAASEDPFTGSEFFQRDYKTLEVKEFDLIDEVTEELLKD